MPDNMTGQCRNPAHLGSELKKTEEVKELLKFRTWF